MRNSRGEIDILVLCQAICLKTLYKNDYTTAGKSHGGVTPLKLYFQGNTMCE